MERSGTGVVVVANKVAGGGGIRPVGHKYRGGNGWCGERQVVVVTTNAGWGGEGGVGKVGVIQWGKHSRCGASRQTIKKRRALGNARAR